MNQLNALSNRVEYRVCILKGSVSELLVSGKSVSWVSARVAAKRRGDTPQLYRKRGRAFPDKPYRSLTTGEYAACATECQEDTKCMGLTNRNSGQCELLDTPSEYQPNPSSDIAYKVELP